MEKEKKMKGTHRIILLAIAITLISGMAWAAEKYSRPKVEYSADNITETEQITMTAKVYSTPDKERREQEMGQMKHILITRLDKKVTWMLMPDHGMYMEMPLKDSNEKSPDMSNYKIEQSVVGKEEVNGVMATKNKIIMTDSQGNKFGGFMWTTKEGIMVKMDAIGKTEGSKMRIKMDLKNLKIGKQDPALFEIPEGMSKMSMPTNMGNPFKGMHR
jgi:outer membrane lipoprotein-sorting protein